MDKINTKLAGVTGTNNDGKSRQVIISEYVNEYDFLELEPEPTEKDPNQVAAFIHLSNDGTKMKVGFLNQTLAPRIIEAWNQAKIVNCMISKVTGRDSDVLGLDCEISISTKQELDFLRKQREEKEKQDYRRKRYRINGGRAVGGIILILFSLIVFPLTIEEPTMLILAFFFLAPGIFLLFPWFRWIYDQIKKMFARKQLRGEKNDC